MDFWSIFMKIIGSDEKSMIFMNPSIITVPVIIHQMYRRTRLVMEPHSENRRSVAACLGFPGRQPWESGRVLHVAAVAAGKAQLIGGSSAGCLERAPDVGTCRASSLSPRCFLDRVPSGGGLVSERRKTDRQEFADTGV